MQINPAPLAIALAIILSAPSFGGVYAAPHGLNQRFVTIEPRQGAAERNAHLPNVPMEGLWPTSASASATATPGGVAIATVTGFETVTVVQTPTMAPIRRPTVQGGTMKPVSPTVSPATSFLNSLTILPTSLSTPTVPTILPVNTIKVLPSSSSIAITVPSWSTMVVVSTPSISIIKPQMSSSTATPSSSSSSTPTPTPTPTPSKSQPVQQATPSSTANTCPATAVTKCCTSLDKVSNSLLTIVHDILPLLNLKKLASDTMESTPVGLSCTDLAEDGVCGNVTSCCTDELVPGFNSVYISCVPLL